MMIKYIYKYQYPTKLLTNHFIRMPKRPVNSQDTRKTVETLRAYSETAQRRTHWETKQC